MKTEAEIWEQLGQVNHKINIIYNDPEYKLGTGKYSRLRRYADALEWVLDMEYNR